MTGLLIHSGGEEVTTVQLAQTPTPESTSSYQPIPHNRLLDLVRANLAGIGYEVASEKHAISHEGNRYFGLLELENGSAPEDYRLIAGLRNSHDKQFPAALALGSRVLVCDNLAFSAEVTLARRHTRYIQRDLPSLVQRALGRLGEMRATQDERIAAYKGRAMDDRGTHDLMIRALRGGVVAPSKINRVADEWYTPRHDDFSPRTAWSLFNGFTEVLKVYPVEDLPKRTQRLHGLFDLACGLVGKN